MKKKILILFSLFMLFISAGTAYLVLTIKSSAAGYHELIQLHQIELFREHLLLNIYKVQTDIYSRNSFHPESNQSILSHEDELVRSLDGCYNCHHSSEVQTRLDDLRQQVRDHQNALNAALSASMPAVSNTASIERLLIIGESLISKVNTLIVLTNKKLTERTQTVLTSNSLTLRFLVFIAMIAPFFGAVLALILMRAATKPIDALVTATKRIQGGDLEYRIVGLKDEFGELAIAFNEMSRSLKRHLRAIEDSEKRYRLVFENAADAILVLEAQSPAAGLILQANKTAAHMHGYEVVELIGKHITMLDSPIEASQHSDRLQQMLRGERIQTQLVHRRKDGGLFPVEVNASLFEIGEHTYILAVYRDITERKQAESELQRAQQLKSAGELAAGLAHEIKNPLAGIKMTIELISEEAYLSDEDKSALKLVLAEIRRIEILMKDLLNYARPTKPNRAWTNVNAVLEDAAYLSLQNNPLGGTIQLIWNLDKEGATVYVDPMHLRQIVSNLIMNASEAMPDGGTLTLSTYHDHAAERLVITISDTGGGIQADVRDRIYRPFFTTKAKGTGLGLSITKRLVEENEGTIAFLNNDAGGTSCSISFPIEGSGQ